MRCKRDRCGQPPDPASGNWKLCTAHLADRKERKRRGALIPKCSVAGCNQQRNSVSDRCGVHWNALLERQRELEIQRQNEQAAEDFKDRLRERIWAAETLGELEEVLVDCVDYWVPL